MLWTMTQKPEIYTRAEVADMLKVSISTVGRLVKEKQLYAFKAGRGVRIPAYSLAAYVAGEAPPHYTTENEPDTSTWPPTPSLMDVLEDHGPDGGAA